MGVCYGGLTKNCAKGHKAGAVGGIHTFIEAGLSRLRDLRLPGPADRSINAKAHHIGRPLFVTAI